MPVVTNEKVLDNVIAWMEERFDGDISTVARDASKMATEQGLISGPLWDEVGCRVLHSIFRERMTSKRRQGLSIKPRNNQPESSTIEDVENLERSYPYYVNGRWYQLFDMAKDEIIQIASYYNELAEANKFECEFLTAIADELSGKEIVRDKFNIDGLKQIRKDVADRLKS